MMELQPGDHIRVTEKTTPARRFLKKLVRSSRAKTDYRHMLVVEPHSEARVHVIHTTANGVREEVLSLDAKDVTVFEYECKFTGKEAIERARDYHGDKLNDEHFVTMAKTGTAFDTDETNTPTKYEAHKIKSLRELKAGDHIRVRGMGDLFLRLSQSVSQLSRKKRKWGRMYTHHMLVVKVVDPNRIRVIHKVDTGVVEETESFKADEIRVLQYECRYEGEEAIARARKKFGEEYNLVTSNCEHFVMEARTGKKLSGQLKMMAAGGLVGGVVGAPMGVVGGVITGAITGGGVVGVFFPLLGAIPGAVAGGVMGGVVGFLGGAGIGAAGGGVGGLTVANASAHVVHGAEGQGDHQP